MRRSRPGWCLPRWPASAGDDSALRNARPVRCRLAAVVAVVAVTSSGCAATRPRADEACPRDQTLRVQGTPVQTRAMAVFRSAWLAQCPDRVFSYLAVDPTDAFDRFVGGEIDVLATHSPLTPEQLSRAAQRCSSASPLHLPMVLRSISLPYNLPGVGTLVLTGRLIAKIFTGDIRTWDDPDIAAVNGGTRLPDLPVIPVLTEERSVLTEDFASYLREFAPDGGFPAASSVHGGTADAAAQIVAETPGAIGYTAHDTFGLPSAQIDSGVGPVAVSAESAMRAIDAAEFVEAGDDLSLAMDTVHRTPEPGGYPLVGVSYDVVCSRGYDPHTLASVRSFLRTAATVDRDAMAQAGYVPLPDFLRDRILDVADSLE